MDFVADYHYDYWNRSEKGSHPSTESTESVLAQKGVLPILDYHFVSNDLEELI